MTAPALPPHAITSAFVSTHESCTDCHTHHFDGTYDEPSQGKYLAEGGQCNDCHKTSRSANAAILGQYAESAHGDTNSVVWASNEGHDWPTRVPCYECHTTSGFAAKFNTENGTTITRFSTEGEIGQPLACNACHANNTTFTLRTTLNAEGNYVAGYLSAIMGRRSPSPMAMPAPPTSASPATPVARLRKP